MAALLLTMAVLIGTDNPTPAVSPEIDRLAFREATERLASAAAPLLQRPPRAAPTFRPRWSRARTICLSALLGMGAGAGIGYAMDRDSDGDSPGMAGFMFGALTGAAAGGILGVLLIR